MFGKHNYNYDYHAEHLFLRKESKIKSVFRIRIRIGSGINQVSGYGSGSTRAKEIHKNIKKSSEFSCFEVLDVLF
jgi:hypothetical protein